MKTIYRITNKNNSKTCIGRSIWLDVRKGEEEQIDKILREEGRENFIIETLKTVEDKEYNVWLDYYIIKYNAKAPNGYNENWSCSEDLIQLLSGLYKDNTSAAPAAVSQPEPAAALVEKEVKPWDDILLTQEDLEEVANYRKYYGKCYLGNDHFIANADKLKEYRYLVEQNTLGRKPIDIDMLKITKVSGFFTPREHVEYDFLKSVVYLYNNGNCLYRILPKNVHFPERDVEYKTGLYTEWGSGSIYKFKYETDKIVFESFENKNLSKVSNMLEKLFSREDFDSSHFHFLLNSEEIPLEKAIELEFKDVIMEIRA